MDILCFNMYSSMWVYVGYKIHIFLLFYKQLFAADEEETDLSDNLIVKTCQKFIPVTGNLTSYCCLSMHPDM